MLDDLQQIQNDGGISICARDECPVLAINEQDDTSRKIIPVELFRASGKKLYAIALGKEGSTGWVHILQTNETRLANKCTR